MKREDIMNKLPGLIIMCLLLVVLLGGFLIYAENVKSINYDGDCFDKYGSRINGLSCESVVFPSHVYFFAILLIIFSGVCVGYALGVVFND